MLTSGPTGIGGDGQSGVDGVQQGYKDILKLSLNAYEVELQKNIALADSVANLSKMDREMSSIVKSMGVTTQYSQLLKQELGRAVTEVSLMGGKQEDINKLQKEFNEATNRTTVLSTENIEKLFAVSQVSGVSAKALESSFRNAGMETAHIGEEMTTVYNTATSLGVNAQVVSASVSANLDKMNRYGFGTGVEGMAKMAAKAAAMRVDMAQTLNVADKLFSPESAIEVASTLQRLGATSSALLDPLKLMDLAQNNVPELQNQLSELSKTFTTFDKKTNTFQIMPEARKQLKEVADALGIDRAEFEKMAIESARIEKKMSEIDLSGLKFKATDDEKMMLANLAEFNKSKGDYTVKFTTQEGNVVEKALTELTETDKEALKNQQALADPQKQLVDIAKEQLGASNTLIAQNNALISTMQTQYAISKSGADFLQVSVEQQKKMYAVGMSEFTLDKDKQKKNDFGDVLFKGLSDISSGKMNDTAKATKFIEDMMTGQIGVFTTILTEQAKLLKENPVGTGLATLALNVDNASKIIGIDLTSAITTAKTMFQTAAQGLTTFIAAFGTAPTPPPTIPPTEGGKDIAVTANGRMFSLDKGDLLMAVNQNALLQSIGSNGSVFASNTPSETKTSPKEIKISLKVTANSNDLQIRNTIMSAFNNDDTMRLLRDKIATVSTDYGLTST
jgi:hypothetical protein